MRIASLLPSATEVVCALGLADELVAVSHDCDYPPEIRGKPVLSEAIVTPDLSSAEIDALIRGQVHRGKSVYHLDETQLQELRPELILTQELCEVCAPSYNLVRQAAKVPEAPTKIISLEPRGLHDILDNILLVGAVTGTGDRAETVVAGLRRRVEQVRARTDGLPKPRVVCIEWLDPIFIGGHWVPEMVAIAGGRDVLGHPGRPSFVAEWEAVRGAEPEVLVLMPCGFDISRTRREITLLMRRPGWDDLPAVRSERVYLTGASSYFNRPGPRIVTGLEILAAIIHPEVFSEPFPTGAAEQL